MSHQTQQMEADFELAWKNRPSIIGDESDKDRALRWWNAALSTQTAQSSVGDETPCSAIARQE
jgi:hypothetical protein